MASDYYDLDQFKADLSIVAAGNNNRAQNAITAASRQIDDWCGRRFWADEDAVARELYADCDDPCAVLLLDQPPTGPRVEISSVTDLVVKTDDSGTGTFGTTLTINTDFLLMPRNAAADGRAFSELVRIDAAWPRYSQRAGVQVTALWGWPAIPDAVTQACGLQAAAIYKSTDAPLGFAGIGVEGQIPARALPMHPAAKGLLAPYRLPPVG